MAYWDGLTENLYQYDADGRRYYTPLGRWGRTYVVPDDDAHRLVRSWRRFHQAAIGLIITVGLLSASTTWNSRVWVVIWGSGLLAVTLGSMMFARWTARSMTEVAPDVHFVPVTSREAFIRYARAVGPKRLARWLGTSVVLTAFWSGVLLIMAIITDTLVTWVAAIVLTIFTMVTAANWRRSRHIDAQAAYTRE